MRLLNLFKIIPGFFKIAAGTTEQKSSEQMQAMLAAIIDSSADAIISKNRSARCFKHALQR